MQLMVAVALVFDLSGCVAIPVDVGDENLLAADNLNFIEIGVSTKEQVATSMSKYLTSTGSNKSVENVIPQKFRDGDWWLYSQVRNEAKWAVITIDATGGVIGEVDYRFALIEFDSNGIVEEINLSSSEGDECNEEGICVGGSFPPQLLAPVEDDRTAKQFTPAENRCGVYVYGLPSSANALWKSIPISLDGRQVGLIVDGRQYYYWELTEGPHQVSFSNIQGTEKTQSSLACKAGATFVLELNIGEKFAYSERKRQTKIVFRSDLAGRTSIRRRRLTLTGS